MSEPSGPQWCPRFPTSASLDDLLPDFGDATKAFISAMKKGGATVSVAATYRPAERAYLMHWCCMIGGSGQDLGVGGEDHRPPARCLSDQGDDLGLGRDVEIGCWLIEQEKWRWL